MSDVTTIARPYAKAIFEHALATDQLGGWSIILHDLAEAVQNAEAETFIGNPATTASVQTELLLVVFSQKNAGKNMKAVENLIAMLANNKRLLVAPDIYIQYEALRALQEKTLAVKVSCFAALNKTQQQRLVDSLSQRLRRHVTLELDIDETLLGGAIIRAGDLVIDGSVRGKLNKLGAGLAA